MPTSTHYDERLLRKAAYLQATVLENPWIPWTPSDKQAEFLALEILEAGYGGAGFAGKSIALLMAASQFLQDPGYTALLLRRTQPELVAKDGLLEIAHRWWDGTDARWVERDKSFHFPSGARVQFGYLESDGDLGRYDGPSYQFVGFDELTGFLENQYRYLFRRIRRPMGSRIPLRMRFGTNPGGRGHDWVKARFIDRGEPKSVMVRANLNDNPFGDRAAYEESLERLPSAMRAQMLNGDWEVKEPGRYFRRDWVPVVHDSRPSDIVVQGRFWDLAATAVEEGASDPDWTAGGLWGLRANGKRVLLHMDRGRWSANTVEQHMKARADEDGPGTVIVVEQEGGASAKILLAGMAVRLFKGFEVHSSPPGQYGSKVVRAQPLSAAMERGEIEVVRGPWLNVFFDEYEAFPKPAPAHDDQVDTGSMAELWLPWLLENRKGNRDGSRPRARRSYA